jgi:outer membrane protein assembly factor BamE (lipoprotein component of BamABCDE complex)
MKKLISLFCLLSCVVFCITSCASTQNNSGVNATDNISVGKVQREIKIGMTSAEVVEILGSPNIVTTDEERRESWVYDKMSTQIDSSSSSRGVWLVVVGAGSEKNKYSSSQRTLTIIIKFDKEGKVRDFSYRTSSF